MFQPLHQPKVSAEKKAQRNEARDIYADIFPVIPIGPVFIPGAFQKFLMEQEKAFWNEQVGGGVDAVVGDPAAIFVEPIQGDSMAVSRQVDRTAPRPVRKVIRNFVGC